MARKTSAFMEQVREIRRMAQEATRKTYMQYLTDTAVIALNRLGWGDIRIRRFLDEWGKVYDEYFDALRQEPETDYYRTKMDEQIKMFSKEEFIPFEQRYEFLPEVKY